MMRRAQHGWFRLAGAVVTATILTACPCTTQKQAYENAVSGAEAHRRKYAAELKAGLTSVVAQQSALDTNVVRAKAAYEKCMSGDRVFTAQVIVKAGKYENGAWSPVDEKFTNAIPCDPATLRLHIDPSTRVTTFVSADPILCRIGDGHYRVTLGDPRSPTDVNPSLTVSSVLPDGSERLNFGARITVEKVNLPKELPEIPSARPSFTSETTTDLEGLWGGPVGKDLRSGRAEVHTRTHPPGGTIAYLFELEEN